MDKRGEEERVVDHFREDIEFGRIKALLYGWDYFSHGLTLRVVARRRADCELAHTQGLARICEGLYPLQI